MAKISICKESEVIEGIIIAYHTKYGPVAVGRSGAKIFAFQEKCSHADVSLTNGHSEGETVICAAHGARFSMENGEALCMPATGPLETFPVTVKDGMVEVEI
jgi:3-phenylpropionate/trans-cinnamate dioxygenase ferredoxin component